jgi:hypothetical protein
VREAEGRVKMYYSLPILKIELREERKKKKENTDTNCERISDFVTPLNLPP